MFKPMNAKLMNVRIKNVNSMNVKSYWLERHIDECEVKFSDSILHNATLVFIVFFFKYREKEQGNSTTNMM